jgi:hypothetical protein
VQLLDVSKGISSGQGKERRTIRFRSLTEGLISLTIFFGLGLLARRRRCGLRSWDIVVVIQERFLLRKRLRRFRFIVHGSRLIRWFESTGRGLIAIRGWFITIGWRFVAISRGLISIGWRLVTARSRFIATRRRIINARLGPIIGRGGVVAA